MNLTVNPFAPPYLNTLEDTALNLCMVGLYVSFANAVLVTFSNIMGAS